MNAGKSLHRRKLKAGGCGFIDKYWGITWKEDIKNEKSKGIFHRVKSLRNNIFRKRKLKIKQHTHYTCMLMEST